MDSRSTAQDVYRCNLCETPIVHSYCGICHVDLCKQCIGEHISDGYEKHKIVPFQDRKSTLINPRCETHPHKSCDFQCKDCKTFICTSCVGSKQHKGHDIWELDVIYKTKKDNIRKDAEELRNLISPTYEEMAHDLENQVANLDKGYEKLVTEITKQGQEWHKEIDVVITEMKTEIYEIKVKHKDILQKHLDEIKKTQSLIEKTAQTLKEIEESNELSKTIEYISENRVFSKLPPMVEVSPPKFITKPVDHQKLYSFFGQINPISTATKQQILMTNTQSNTSISKLLDEPEHVLKIETFLNELSNVAYVNDEKIWTSGGATGEIKCFNDKGLLLQTIKTTSGEWPDDIAVDSDGDLIFSTCDARTVNKVKNGQTIEFIMLLGWKPCQLCVTSTGDLLVTMFSDDETQSKVVRFTGSTKKKTFQFDDEGKPLFSGNHKIKYITENINYDICVADSEAGAIVVVDQYGKLRFRYTGHTFIKDKSNSFGPHGITTDSQSHILTADANSNCIHILDENGQFLRHIKHSKLKFPRGLCVDNKDNLFVCDYEDGFVHKIKYVK